MADLQHIDGGYLINTTPKPSWWKQNHAALVPWIAALISLLGAGASWYETWRGRVDEHRPLLEIIEDMKSETTFRVKNSGRSAALKIRNQMWCELGQPVANAKGPNGFKVEFSIPIGVMKTPDVPSSDTFSTGSYIPGKGLFPNFDSHYKDDSSLRLQGSLIYEDANHNHYELPWCYESLNPKTKEKPTFFPCWYMEPL